jgi:Carboxypeptidase regulatory-like domain/TonB-dependent Receptor Plug Domain
MSANVADGFASKDADMKFRNVARLAVVLWLVAGGVRAQTLTDAQTLTGVAVDSTGLALPGVTVTLTRTTQAEPLVLVTDGSGRFIVNQVQAGSYRLSLALPGFQDKGVDVEVPSLSELRIVLELAGFSESLTVTPDQEPVNEPAPGTATLEEKQLSAVPLKSERFEDALPLLPGVVRGPDGLLNMNGARGNQSALFVNGVNMTDPVTGGFAVRLPLEAIETITVHGGASAAAFGSATGSVADVVIRPGQDRFAIQVQNVIPRVRYADDAVRGVDSFTPRLRVSGPLQKGRAWFSDAVSYRFVRSRVDELQPLDESEQIVESFDALSQTDYAIRDGHHLSATLVWFPSDIDNAGIDTLHPFDSTPDIEQRGWSAEVADRASLSDRTTLATSLASREYDMNVAPKHVTPSVVAVTGLGGNYFNRFDRNSHRYDIKTTLTHFLEGGGGSHLIKAGAQYADTRYDGIDASLPVIVFGADGTPIQRIDFFGNSTVGANNSEVAALVDDEWSASARATLRAGVRYSHDGISGDHTFAPRVEATIRPFSSGRTVVKAGAGRLFDKLPLSADDFERHQSRRISFLDESGATTREAILDSRVASEGLRTPGATAVNAEVDQQITRTLSGRVSYRHVRGFDQLVVDPLELPGSLLLSSRGRTRVHELEATIRRQFDEAVSSASRTCVRAPKAI